ncbi:hypothetical protein BDZ89DRAFT_1070411 [Hymenopellis radicata]|nr:hypothetical protein BDZ89DRAFT_1070411 [Hymenopellis radicata]
MTITFYDIPSGPLPNAPFSPSSNTWKTRYALNHKGIEYTTTWIEYPDIAPLYAKLGVRAVFQNADGTPLHTLPLVHDHATGAIVSDSHAIAEYLDNTYRAPEYAPLFPLGQPSYGLHRAFHDAFEAHINSLWQFCLPGQYAALNPASQAFFKPSKENMFGKKLEDFAPRGEEGAREWEKVKAGFDAMDKWYGDNPFVLGDQLSFADMEIAAFVLWIQTVLGVESREWKDVSTWNGGRWAQLLDGLQKRGMEALKV